jgi:hypothetical protein
MFAPGCKVGNRTITVINIQWVAIGFLLKRLSGTKVTNRNIDDQKNASESGDLFHKKLFMN